MASAKQILGLEPPAVVKQEASPNTAADPLLLSSATEYVQAPTRADQSTFATGPTLDLGGLRIVRGLNAVAPNSSTSPAGAGILGSSGGMP